MDGSEQGVQRRSRRGRKTVAATGLAQQSWHIMQNHMAPMSPLSADQLESVHQASLKIIEEYGVEVMSLKARDRPRAST